MSRCNNINAANIKAVADAMIKNGLASIGYEYLVSLTAHVNLHRYM